MIARYPEIFWLFLVFIPLTVVTIWRYFSGIKGLRAVGGEWRFDSLRDIYMVKWFFSSLGFLVFTAASILALAGFPGESVKEPFKATGHDVIYVVDISRSMLAEDTLPSRLEKAKGHIHSISDGLESRTGLTGNRYSLVIYRGAGSRLLPLTEDRGGLYGTLDILTPDLMSSPGTDIASGLNTAMESFVTGSETNRHIILFTDGEALEGDLGPVLNRFREERVNLTIIGLGTEEGAFIPLEGGDRVTDAAGRDVVTRRDSSVLRQAAFQAGGVYLEGEDSRLLERVFDSFDSGETGTSGSGGSYIQVEQEQFRLYLLIALAGLLVYQAAGVIRLRERL